MRQSRYDSSQAYPGLGVSSGQSQSQVSSIRRFADLQQAEAELSAPQGLMRSQLVTNDATLGTRKRNQGSSSFYNSNNQRPVSDWKRGNIVGVGIRTNAATQAPTDNVTWHGHCTRSLLTGDYRYPAFQTSSCPTRLHLQRPPRLSTAKAVNSTCWGGRFL